MSPFSIDKWTPATVSHVNKRTENHGNEKVHAKDINWRLEGPNTILDLIFPGLRQALYRASDTQDIPGVEASTPELRTNLIEGKLNLKGEGTGYLITIKHGQVSGAKIELGGSEVDQFKLEPKDGGTAVLYFRTSHVGLTKALMGDIDMLDGKEVEILIAPPSLQDGTAVDSKKKSAPADTKTQQLPLEGGGKAEESGHEVRTDSARGTETQSGEVSGVGEGASPFKYSVKPGGGIIDNNPEGGPSATDIFAQTHGNTPSSPAAAPAAAPTKKAPAKKAATKKVTSHTKARPKSVTKK